MQRYEKDNVDGTLVLNALNQAQHYDITSCWIIKAINGTAEHHKGVEQIIK